MFRLPKDDTTDYIKRVIGLPGDRIQMKDGLLYINDVPVKRERLSDFIGEDPCAENDLAATLLRTGRELAVRDRRRGCRDDHRRGLAGLVRAAVDGIRDVKRVIASEAIYRGMRRGMDCFVASLLAMTRE